MATVLCGGCGSRNTSANASSEQLCGGYTDPQTPTDEELEMFYKLASGESTELTPISVSRQVVNGTNYKFLCVFRDEQGKQGNCIVNIYKPLNGDPVVRSLELTDK